MSQSPAAGSTAEGEMQQPEAVSAAEGEAKQPAAVSVSEDATRQSETVSVSEGKARQTENGSVGEGAAQLSGNAAVSSDMAAGSVTEGKDKPAVASSDNKEGALQQEPEDKSGTKSADSEKTEIAQALREGYDTLVEVRDTLYAYYRDETIPDNEEVIRGIRMADELIEKINRVNEKNLKTSRVAELYDEMSDVMDVFARIEGSQDPRTIDILSMREALKGSMWIDDEINTYIFDKDGKTMYVALAGQSTPCGGNYEVSFTEETIRFTFSIPELTTEIKGDVMEFTDRSFKFTDVNTGDQFYLTPVER